MRGAIRSSLLTLAAAIAVASAGGAMGGQPVNADLIVTNGRVFTGAGNPRQDAIAVRDGRIVAVGGRADIERMKGSATAVVDAAGAAFPYSPCSVRAATQYASVGPLQHFRQRSIPGQPAPPSCPRQPIDPFHHYFSRNGD